MWCLTLTVRYIILPSVESQGLLSPCDSLSQGERALDQDPEICILTRPPENSDVC